MTLREQGNLGEELARHYLENKGYLHISSNWLCKVGEIDLVMQYGPIRVFIEVRMRKSTHFGQGLETVTLNKQRKIIRAAQFYQIKEGYWGDAQFDVISIKTLSNGSSEITHIPHAFELQY